MESDHTLEQPTVVATYSAIHEAEFAQGHLEDQGIDAFIARDDAGGAYPQMQLTQGVRLVVRSRDANKAHQVLEEADALPKPRGPRVDNSFYQAERQKMWHDLSRALLGIGAFTWLATAVGWYVTGRVSTVLIVGGLAACLAGAIARHLAHR